MNVDELIIVHDLVEGGEFTMETKIDQIPPDLVICQNALEM